MDDQQSPSLPWQQDVKANDIVAFRFPHERESTEQPKVRPTLVLDVLTIGDERYALLAFGTSSRRRRARALLVHVDCAKELDTASLKAPTLFDGARRILVALSHSGFSYGQTYNTPILGQLSGRSARYGDAVRRSVLQMSSARRSSLYGRRPPR
ncbi:hypothetical protein ACOI1H_19805 [Loktanella sp. DJP18]|uniref:hypothetical protein n=1 Tax=Loktanella sp. DJP18 TaxID=3409788 RepID=UPI003BB7D55A